MDFRRLERVPAGDGNCKSLSVNVFNAVLAPGEDGRNLADLAWTGIPMHMTSLRASGVEQVPA